MLPEEIFFSRKPIEIAIHGAHPDLLNDLFVYFLKIDPSLKDLK
jgi:hypothetical protein